MKNLSVLIGITMLVVAGVVVYQVNGNVFPLKNSQGSVIGNCIPGYLSDSVCDTMTCTQMYNTGTTDPMTGGCIIESRTCEDTRNCELPPPSSAGQPNVTCCKNAVTSEFACKFPFRDTDEPADCLNGTIKVGEFPRLSCVSDCQMFIESTFPPSSAPIMPPIVDINPVPPDTTDVEPPVITITPPSYGYSSSIHSSQSISQKICSDKKKTGSVTGESEWIQASLWANYESMKKSEALMSAQGKCASATSIIVDGCGTCVDKGLNRTLKVSSVTYSQVTKLAGGTTYIKSMATGSCEAVRTCDCPTNNSQCTKM